MLFFQALLLTGYAYADALTRRFRPRAQLVLHLAVLGLAALALPVRLSPGWEGPGTHGPTLWLLALLGRTVGLPFFVMATTGPLLQAWFSRSGHRQASDPYFLYAASNLGSLAGLLAYPFLLEPLLPWRAGGSPPRAASGRRATASTPPPSSPAGSWSATARRRSLSGSPWDLRPPLRARMQWLLLAFVPSSVLLGSTQSMSSEIAPVPLLWVLPLSAYLLSFVLAFRARAGSRRPSGRRRWW
jgi:hypothetical protein